jgi:hypothetical protein
VGFKKPADASKLLLVPIETRSGFSPARHGITGKTRDKAAFDAWIGNFLLDPSIVPGYRFRLAS